MQCYCARVIREKNVWIKERENIYSTNCIFVAFTCKLFLFTFALIFRFLEESLVVLQHQNTWLGSSWFSCGVVMLWYQHLWHMTSFLLVFDTFSINTYLWSCFTTLCGQSNWNCSDLSNYLRRMATWLILETETNIEPPRNKNLSNCVEPIWLRVNIYCT